MRLFVRPPVTVLLAVSLVVPTALVLPTISASTPQPRPVSPEVQTLPLRGVDRAALRASEVPTTAALRQTGRVRPVVLTRELSTQDYRMLAVTWDATSAREALVSARTRTDGRWTDWIEIHVMHDLESGSPNGRLGTEPYWAGDSDGVQVRVDAVGRRTPTDLRIDLIEPGTSPADAAITDPPPAGTAFADDDHPNIVTRAEWGANEALRDKRLDMSRTIKAAFVHHTAGSNSYGPSEGPAVVRGLYSYYVGSLGYGDMGYNFLVDRYGNVYEGRAGSITTPVRQAATGGFNKDTMAVVALGNFETVRASNALVKGIARLLAFRLSAYHLDPYGTRRLRAEDGSSRYSRGDIARFKVISGHRDAGFTACPGGNLYRRMSDIRRNAADYMGANLVRPRASPTVVRASDDVNVAVRSGVLGSQNWTLTITRLCSGEVVRRVTGTASASQPIRATWLGRDSNGDSVRPGRYRLSLTSTADGSRSWPWSRIVTVGVGGARGELPTSPLPAVTAGSYVPIAPRTLVDTVKGVGVARPMVLGARSRVTVPVLGRAGVPASGVSAVAVSVVGSCASAATDITVGPRGGSSASRVVSVDRNSTARGVTLVRLGRGGELVLANRSGAVGVNVAVVGYVTAGGSGGSLTPAPRATLRDAAPLAVSPTARTIVVAGRAGVPADARAVVLNVRRPAASRVSSVWAWRPGDVRPKESSWRRDTRGRTASRVIVPLGAGGDLKIAADRGGEISLDVAGYVARDTQALLRPVAPTSLVAASRLGAGETRTISVRGRAAVPSAARSVVLQVSGIRARRDTHLTVWPRGGDRPASVDLWIPRRHDRDGLVLVPIGARGDVRIAAGRGSVGLRAVVLGWIA